METQAQKIIRVQNSFNGEALRAAMHLAKKRQCEFKKYSFADEFNEDGTAKNKIAIFPDGSTIEFDIKTNEPIVDNAAKEIS